MKFNLKWDEDSIGPTRVWKCNIENQSLERQDLHEVFEKAWLEIAAKIAPRYQSISWNIIRVELIEELGRVRFYPIKFDDHSQALAGCELYISAFQEAIFRNDRNHTFEAEAELEGVIDSVARSLVEAATSEICQILARRTIRIDVCFSGDNEPIVTRTLVGN